MCMVSKEDDEFFTKVITKIQAVHDQLAKDGKLNNPEMSKSLTVSIAQIACKTHLITRDGITVSDIYAFAGLIEPLVQIAQTAFNSNVDRADFVKDALFVIYVAADEGFEEDKKNYIDIPLISGEVERDMERRVIFTAVDFAVKALLPVMKKAGFGRV
jgi:hypothetical protein